MILTTHILSGAVVGKEISNPCTVAGLSIAVHFLMDLVPHGDYLNKKSKVREFWKVALDLAIGLGTIAIILFFRDPTPKDISNICIGIFFSLLPDGTTFLYWKMGMKFLKPIKMFHEKLHYYPEFSPGSKFCPKNNLFDVLISMAAVAILIFLR